MKTAGDRLQQPADDITGHDYLLKYVQAVIPPAH
jgi:hypothetical protein